MHFTTQTASNGVIERDFVLGDVTGVLWSPESGSDGAPLHLMGHGGGLHKKAQGLVARAHYYVTTCGFTVAAIDAPGHGDRPRSAEDGKWVSALLEARAAGQPIGPIVIDYNSSLAERAVPEWQATLDALQALPEIGTDAPVGYSGMTLASTIGLMWTAIEPRISAAVFGGVFVYDALTEAARQITIPVEFILPWDDAEIDRESGFALFDAFASKEKTLHANPGGHHEVPWFETEISGHFFARHLGRSVPSRA
ncbi:alpha/beta hydrolase [Kribbella capetownensis]|uniref:Alpha/beta hydrolase n=1 Tax=Kribbella capetownensis TaxID=1572659 RepID=A0A4R0JVB6_9ACTN|nr:alpha/beta hydrolase [Kribbella capetownensis]TCC50949.1 alpha/beta hydrolase [Kribbella capetownensis]